MNDPTVSKYDLETFVDNLRQQTAERHKQLEANEISKSILNPSVNRFAYQAYLGALYGITLACESDIFPIIIDLLPDLSQRHKAAYIADDLVSMGFRPEEIASIPVCKFDFTSVAQALGVMYVIEGSTLGGRILYKHVHRTLGLTAEKGARYFWGYGQETGLRWKTFMAVLAQYAVREHMEQQIITSAIQTFTTIDTWLREVEINNKNEY